MSLSYRRAPVITRIVILALFTLVHGQLWAEINIGTTIRPLHLIAAEIARGAGNSSAILPANQSPHHYSLQPDDRLQIARSDLLLWVGPELETYLASLVSQLASDKNIIQVSALPKIDLARFPDGEADPHVWLDTRNAIVIARAITESLSAIDTMNAAVFSENLRLFLAGIAELEKELAGKDLKATAIPYAVYHNGYGYFERQWGLEHTLAFTEDSDHLPPMREMMALRVNIASRAPGCLIVDVEAKDSLIATLMQDREFNQESLDIMGAEVAEGVGAYAQLIRNIHSGFQRCVSP